MLLNFDCFITFKLKRINPINDENADNNVNIRSLEKDININDIA